MRRTIVLIDDNDDDAFFLERAFAAAAPDCGWTRFCGGADAIAGLERMAEAGEGPSLVVLDLNLGGGATGFDVLERIRSRVELMASVVLILSTSSALHDVRRAYRQRANAFITKPRDLTEFDQLAAQICAFWLRTARLPTDL